MAGSDAGFDSQGFRDGITLAMQLGAPPDPGDQIVFHFPNVLVYNSSTDAANVPFDPHATVTNETPPPVKVDCAIEFADAENQSTDFGLLSPSRIIVTMLDESYEQVKECSYAVIAGDRYDYRRTEPPVGLYDVGVYTMHFTSSSET